MKLKLKNAKNSIFLYDVDINKILVSNKVSFCNKGFKYFIGYKYGKEVRPLCVTFPKMRAYSRDFAGNKYMSFLIKNDEILEKYNEIWNNVSNAIKKEYASEPVYNENILEVKYAKRRFSVYLFISNAN